MVVFTRQGLVACVAVAVTVTGAAVALAQAGADEPAAGSLAGVAAEIRQLRAAVEESTRSQAQTQALGVYISAQQSRVAQLAGRLDAARRELDALTAQSRQIAADLTSNEDQASRATKPELKSDFELQGRALKYELDKVTPQLQQAQTRESELSQMLHAEEARWTDLIARLEQLVRK